MPRFDRSGPLGTGPMTGGRRGLCGGAYGRPGSNYGYGRGPGLRRGQIRGRCFGYPGTGGYAPGPSYPATRADEMALLQAEAEAMKASLESVQNRIAELKKDASE